MARGIAAGGRDRGGVAHRHAVDPFAGQHGLRGAAPVDMRHAELLFAAGALIKLRGRSRLHAQVQFQSHQLRQCLHHRNQAQAPRLGRQALADTGEQRQRFQVAGKIPAHMRSQDLHRHRYLWGVAGLGAVHLGDGGRRQRRAETREQGFDRLAKGAFDLRPRLGFGKRRQPVLEVLQRTRHLHSDNVGPRRQHLAELDIGRPQFFQGAAETRARIGAVMAEGQRRPEQQACGMEKPEETGQGAHQRRQAECMAAMPPERLRTFTCSRPASAIIWANFACGGKRRMLSAR